MNSKNKNKVIFIGVVSVVLLFALVLIGVVMNLTTVSNSKPKSLDEMLKDINVSERTPVKASVSLDDTSLYDELPDINKYPLVIKGNGDIDLEIFSSGEKAGDGYDSWLLDVAEEFNSSGIKTSDGRTVSVSVRQVSSGLGADYIISNKYLPDLYTPSNSLFGELVNSQGGDLSMYNPRLVGNTAGVLVSKNKGYKSLEDVVKAVKENKLNLGYTNPQTSASGLNFLVTLLKTSDSKDMFSKNAEISFSEFQSNIPFVAYTTMQMRDSAKNGSLDGMIMEYQTYTNEDDLNSIYDFIPYGIRHDNPLYSTEKAKGKEEAIRLFNDFCMSDKMQNLATKKGFNANEKYSSSLKFSGAEVSKALTLYKKNKDSGKDVIAVLLLIVVVAWRRTFITVKGVLSNGAKYINDNNLVLVSYSTDVSIELPIEKFDLNQRAYFQGSVERLMLVSTASYDAVLVATDMIKKAKKNNPDAKAMIFLLSDGCANDGILYHRLKTQ